jgi:S-adenosylmethionine-diacylgycerolhomoserine-N-methlytransferase
LESFYGKQAADYDAFRKKLLHGRREMLAAVPAKAGSVWCDLGAGTGESAQLLADRLDEFTETYLVDLCPSLLEVAERRALRNGWKNVHVVHRDVRAFDLPDESVDLVTFSYSLTMIPDWFAAVENAYRMLRPGGHLGVVDFFVARKHCRPPLAPHSWLTRSFWPLWFAADNVFLSPDHLPYLRHRFEQVRLDQRRGQLPYVPFARPPYYLFIGRKS